MGDCRQRRGQRAFPILLSTHLNCPQNQALFDDDDLLDEDKVMMALWARWILLNRYVYYLMVKTVPDLIELAGFCSSKTTYADCLLSLMRTGG